MNSYVVVLFIHAIAVFVLVAALTFEASMLFQLRRVSNGSDARTLTAPAVGLSVTGISALAVVFFTGGYLTDSLNAWGFAWPRMAVLAIVIFAILGALAGRRLRAMRRLVAGSSVRGEEIDKRTQSPFLKVSLCVRIWIVLGTTLLTAAKPGLAASAGILAASLVLGLASSLGTLRWHTVQSLS